MSNVIFLSPEHFKKNGQTLLVAFPGISMVLYYSPRNPTCKNLVNHFKAFPNARRGGITFGMLNVNDQINAQVAQASLGTTFPITVTPTILLYIDNYPVAMYKGPFTNPQAILDWLDNVVSQLQVKQPFTRPRQPTAQAVAGYSPSSLQQHRQPMPMAMQQPMHSPQQQQMQQQPQLPMRPSSHAAAVGGPRDASGMATAAAVGYTISPTTGVKEYANSYGRPYNTTSEAEYLEYEQAYNNTKSVGAGGNRN